MKIALDAMGGDHAPASEVEGAALAVREYGVEVVLVGDDTLLKAELRRQGVGDLPGLTVHHASRGSRCTSSPRRSSAASGTPRSGSARSWSRKARRSPSSAPGTRAPPWSPRFSYWVS